MLVAFKTKSRSLVASRMKRVRAEWDRNVKRRSRSMIPTRRASVRYIDFLSKSEALIDVMCRSELLGGIDILLDGKSDP